ncbi:hypothetical protein GNP82_17740 [Aliivibrio fischeri]|uniref:hypothetical protein n=1 Tax=Aliivibrio fischeri TaxID=668 RepID=UPI0012D93862|nr:hypothetical protein [Aliivibrio fischeri]MUK39388.1 hypothetical protein [Aliivibrio fischeri]MUL04338.1 hypothetical protein [Aliivibrio fischeri]MUL07965.1 hypothetical protein [Aliivibrio fischeri]
MSNALRIITVALMAITALPAAAAGWQQFTNPDGTRWTLEQYTQFKEEWKDKSVTSSTGDVTAIVKNVVLSTSNGYQAAFIEIDASPQKTFVLGETGITTIGGLYWTSVKAELHSSQCGTEASGYSVVMVSETQGMIDIGKVYAVTDDNWCVSDSKIYANPSLIKRLGHDAGNQVEKALSVSSLNSSGQLALYGATPLADIISLLGLNQMHEYQQSQLAGYIVDKQASVGTQAGLATSTYILISDDTPPSFYGPTVSFVYYDSKYN